MNYPRRFIFHANASGVSAHIRRPEDRILPVQAVSSLPATGGISESKVGHVALGDYLHCLYAETTAHGDFIDKAKAIAITNKELAADAVAAQTVVSATVRGLSVGKRFVADLATMRLVSTSPEAGTTQPTIRLEGNQLQGVVVDGKPLEITLNEKLFCDNDTYAKLQGAYAELPDDQMGMFWNGSGANRSMTLYESDGSVHATLVGGMVWPEGEPEGLQTLGPNAFYLEGFGAVYFGEVVITALSRRVTMIRFQLGSDVGGDASAAEGETNGSFFP